MFQLNAEDTGEVRFLKLSNLSPCHQLEIKDWIATSISSFGLAFQNAG